MSTSMRSTLLPLTPVARYGEWAVVTGASSGIGRDIALQLAARGISVCLAARSEAALKQLAAEIQSAHRVQALPIPLDLAQPGGPRALLETVKGLNIGLLVNCAGFGTGGAFIAADVEEQSSMIDLNCRATMELTHEFARRFVAQRRGGIVLLSSIVALQGVPYSANYAATKAYVHSLGEALAHELSSSGVHVLTATPGPTASGFAERAGMRFGQAESSARVARDIVAALFGGRSHVVPGFKAKTLVYSLRTAPRFLRVHIMKRIMKSMTR